MRPGRIRRKLFLVLLLCAALAVMAAAQTPSIYGPISTPALTIGSGPTVTASGGGTSKFLRADGTWAVPSGAAAVPVVFPESFGAKGDGVAYFDGAVTVPSVVSGSNSGFSTTPATPSITTTANNSVALYIFLTNQTWTTAPSTGTNRVVVPYAAGEYASTVNEQLIATAAATGSVAGTLSASTNWDAGAIAMSPLSGSSIAFVAAGTAQQASGTSITVTTPTGTAVGDTLVACVDWYTAGNGLTWPAGFNAIFAQSDAGNDQLDCRFARPSSIPANYRWSQTATSGLTVSLLSYRGVNSVTPLTSNTANFTSADAGKTICTAGTALGGGQQCGTILSWISATQVNLNYSVQQSVSSVWFTMGSDDDSAFSSMLGSAPCSTLGCRVQLQPHVYILTAALTLPPNRTIQVLGAGYGTPNSPNNYINGNSPTNGNTGSRLIFDTTGLGGPAITIGGTIGITSNTAFDLLSDLAVMGGAGKARDGGGGNGINITNWQGASLNRVLVANFAGNGVYMDGLAAGSNKDYSEDIYMDGLYSVWNGGAGVQIGSALAVNNLETTSLQNAILESNGGPGILVAGANIQGFYARNNVSQWNNVAAANPEIEITGTIKGCQLANNYLEADTILNSQSNAWITSNVAGCNVENNYIFGTGSAASGYTGINTTSPATQWAVNGNGSVTGLLSAGSGVQAGTNNTDIVGYDVREKATAALTGEQLVCLDTANADSVVVCPTTATAQMIGFADGAISAGATGNIRVQGKATPASTTTCAIGNYVIVSSTTAGDVQCTSTLPAQATMVGFAETALATAPGAVTVLIDKR